MYVYPTVQAVLGMDNGRRLQIRCPSGTHRDSTASFMLYRDGSAYCFGCGVHCKNGLDFLIKMLGNSVKDSMAYLKENNLLTEIQ